MTEIIFAKYQMLQFSAWQSEIINNKSAFYNNFCKAEIRGKVDRIIIKSISS